MSLWIKPHFSRISGSRSAILQPLSKQTGFYLFTIWNAESFFLKFCVDTVTSINTAAPIPTQFCVASPYFSLNESNTWLHVIGTASSSLKNMTIIVRLKRSCCQHSDSSASDAGNVDAAKFAVAPLFENIFGVSRLNMNMSSIIVGGNSFMQMQHGESEITVAFEGLVDNLRAFDSSLSSPHPLITALYDERFFSSDL